MFTNKVSKYLPQIVAMLFLAGFAAFAAWQEPSQPPPQGNVEPPVNTGSASQVKAGALGIGGVLRAFSDLIVDGKVGIGTTDPQGQLDVGGGKLVVTSEGAINFTSGPSNPTLIANNGGFDWINPSNAAASDNNYALAGNGVDCGGGINIRCSNFLKATGFNFSLPANAVIDGILAEIERKGVNILGYNLPQDNEVKIVKGGIIQGNNKASGFWPVTDTYQPYGGPADRWGLSFIASDINSSDFGVAISAALNGDVSDGWGTAYVDHIRIKVYYHTGGADVVKVSSVTIAGDGSLSTNLNADKLDGLHASEIGRNGLYGWCSYTYHGPISGNDHSSSAYPPAYAIASGGQSCSSDIPGTCGCWCSAGYIKIQMGGPTSAFPPQTSFYSCYKQ